MCSWRWWWRASQQVNFFTDKFLYLDDLIRQNYSIVIEFLSIWFRVWFSFFSVATFFAFFWQKQNWCFTHSGKEKNNRKSQDEIDFTKENYSTVLSGSSSCSEFIDWIKVSQRDNLAEDLILVSSHCVEKIFSISPIIIMQFFFSLYNARDELSDDADDVNMRVICIQWK